MTVASSSTPVHFQGGFAKCYVFTSLETNMKYCGKVVSKATLVKSKAKQKVLQQTVVSIVEFSDGFCYSDSFKQKSKSTRP